MERSWRVRWSAAKKFHELCASLGGEVTNESLCGAYETLLQDGEAEVRVGTAVPHTVHVYFMRLCVEYV